MTRRMAIIAGVIVGAVCLSATQLSSARDTGGRAKRAKKQLTKQITAMAQRSGNRAIFPADNSPCLVCHGNFDKETLAATHLPHGLTCVLCHGLSYEHRDDENHVTKPDLLFGRGEIEPLCRKCHGKHEQPERVKAFREQWEEKATGEGRMIAGEPTCTDCHGEHSL
ncbi:MAG: cytochrome c3 family protein [Armatimonadota bacterium]